MSSYTENVEKATESFRKLVLASYELDDAFVDAICGFYTKTVTELLAGLPAPKPAKVRGASAAAAAAAPSSSVEAAEPAKKEKAVKGSRKKSPYNIFVREMMKTAEVQSLDHKQKMGAIAGKWKSLDEGSKAEYTRLANEENESSKTEELTLAEGA
jgi:hypothetical protein